MRFKLLLLASAFLAGPASAEQQQVRSGPPPAWVTQSPLMDAPATATGAVFVRRQDVEVHLSSQGQAQYLGYRIKILQPSALRLGNVSIAWDPELGAPIVHAIRIFREGAAIDVLKAASFEILRREDELEAAKLSGTLTAVFRVPDLRVGDELEVTLTTFTGDPTLAPHNSGFLALPSNPAPGRFHLGLGWETGHQPSLKMTDDMAANAVKGDAQVDFRFDNPKLPSPPKDAPPRYLWQHVVEYSDYPDWPTLSRQLALLFEKASRLAPGSAVKLEADRIAKAHVDHLGRAAAALTLVQQNVRYIYVGLNGGNMTPASAEETWRRRYGDCKGKTALLIALLNELGIKAEPVLVNSTGLDDGFDSRLPEPQLFDHVLVRANIDGESYWLDGTLPAVAAPSLRPVFPVRWVLPLSAAGRAIENLGWRPATTPDEIHLFEIDARDGFDKPARIVTTDITRGAPGLQQQIEYSAASAAQLLDVYRQRAIGDVFQAIDDVQWRYDQKAGASILMITGRGKINWENGVDGSLSYGLPGGGFTPPERRVRASDPDTSIPFYLKPEYACYVTTVRTPSATRQAQWTSKGDIDQDYFGKHYHRAWEFRDGAIRMVHGSRVEQPEIDPVTAERDNARISGFDNSMGYIFYDPHRRDGAIGSGKKVPATYELDWTADDVPCLWSRPAK